MLFRYEGIKNMLLDKKTCAERLPNTRRKLNNFKYYALWAVLFLYIINNE